MPPTPVSVRFTNDSENSVELLWHKVMEGGLVVAQHVATIVPTRSRIIRSFVGHEFSVWDGDAEVQHWSMRSSKRQHYLVSSATPVQEVRPARRAVLPSTAALERRGETTTKKREREQRSEEEQPAPLADPRLAEARRLASAGRYGEALTLFKAVGSFSPSERPKLAARISYLERMIAGEAQIKGDKATAGQPKRCETCTLPEPCGKTHCSPSKTTQSAGKRSWADVASAGTSRDPSVKSVAPPALPSRPRPAPVIRRRPAGKVPLSAEETERLAKREERLSQLIARAKASAERARASAQRAREIRSVGVLRDSGSEGSEEEDNEGERAAKRVRSLLVAKAMRESAQHSARLHDARVQERRAAEGLLGRNHSAGGTPAWTKSARGGVHNIGDML